MTRCFRSFAAPRYGDTRLSYAAKLSLHIKVRVLFTMTKLIRLSMVLALLTVHTLASAQSLWGGTEYGMSVDQVKSVVPNVTTPTSPSGLLGGAQELLRLENVQIVNKRFAASFYFIAGKLTQVTLSFEKGHTFRGAMLVVDSLTEALRAKYGREINRDIKRGVPNIASTTWMAGRTNINILAMGVENEAFLNINYQVQVALDAGPGSA